MEERDLEETRERYRERWLQYGYDPRTLGWNKGLQSVRFLGAVESLRPEEHASVLDVGCGFGDFLSFLRGRGWTGSYRGVDVVPELIDEARRRHGADGAFECRDASAGPITGKSAMALAIGMFNHRLRSDHWAFVEETFAAMWNATTHVVVVDFLSTTADQRREDLFFADPCDAFALGRKYSRRLAIHHGYMPFEFQLKVWHDQAFDVKAPAFSPYLSES
jgi:SAM-dependent methyltransferase